MTLLLSRFAVSNCTKIICLTKNKKSYSHEQIMMILERALKETSAMSEHKEQVKKSLHGSQENQS